MRRTRLLAEDAISSTWEGWEGWRGVRVRLRVLAEPFRQDPAARACLQRAVTARGSVEWVDDAWPRLVGGPVRRTLADLLPWEDHTDPTPAAWLLGGVATSLAALHHAGATHGAVDPGHVVLDDEGWRLLWLGPVPGAPDGSAQADLRGLGHLAALITHPEDPVGSLLADFIDYPPLAASDGALLIARALGAALAAERHGIVRRSRRFDHGARLARLRGLAARLASLSPPVARGCLRVEPDGAPFLLASDGQTVFAGPVPDAALTGLPAVADREDLDVAAVRAVLRAHRAPDPEGRAATLTRGLGGDPVALARLVRWLAAALTLRTERRLLVTRG